MTQESRASASQNLVEELERLGVHLWLEGSALRFRSRPGALTEELRARIGACRDDLIEYLRTNAVTAPPAEVSVQELIASLRARDIQLAVSDGKLKVNAPKGAVDEQVRALIAARRDELIAALGTPSSDELISVSRAGELPLSHMQQRLWFMKQMDPHSAAYNVPAVLRFRGSLNADALNEALTSVVERHESLRTRFLAVEGQPRCVVEPVTSFSMSRESLESGSPEQRLTAALARAEEIVAQPFDVRRCPLIRATLLTLGPDDHVFLCVLDHIVADGLSVGLLLVQMLDRYERLLANDRTPVTPPRYQYLDYADWQHRRFESGALAEHLAFWKKELAALPPALQLPTDRPRPPVQTYAGSRVSGRLDATQTAAVKALARREGATLFMVLMSAFHTLLHRYSGETDIPVGTAVANRGRADFEQVIGFFANNVVLRGDLSGNPTVSEAIRRTRDLALRSFAHESMPFDVLVEALAPRRSLDHSPLFQVMFVLQTMARRASMPGLQYELLEPPMRTSRFDFSVDAVERDGSLWFFFEYNTDLYDAETLQQMVSHYLTLLKGYCERPDAPVKALPLLTEEETRRLAVDWNRTERPLEAPLTVHGLFEAQAARTPNAIAVKFEDQSLSYADLDRRASELAAYLASLQPGGDRLIGIWMERGIDMIVALLGVLKAGCAYVPLDPAFPRDRIAYMVEDAALQIVVTQQALAAALPAQGVRCVLIDSDLPAVEPAQAPVRVSPHDLAYVIYTSGSTGKPKGVQLEHRGVVNFLHSMHREPGIGPRDRLVSVTTLSFDIAGLEIYGPLTIGGTVIMASRAVALDGLRLAELLEHHEATILQATPATWRLLLDSDWAGRPGMKMLCGGEALPRDLATRLLETGGELWNLYGPTETTIWSTVTRVEDTRRPISIGRPLDNTTVYLLEPSGQLAPVGVPGELCIGGAGLARGYRNRPELTNEKFVMLPLPGGRSERVYRTGDLARWRRDGQLEFVGRRDHQVKVRGFRIELEEIEAVLATHAGVRQNVVAVREDTPGDQRLVAYVVPEAGARIENEQARATLRAKLPEYMVPGTYVVLEELPLTPNGKVDRRALPPPPAAVEAVEQEDTAARTPAEQRVTAIWRDVLKLDRIGLHQNFFDVGGHSLLLVRVQTALKREFGQELQLFELFQSTTIASQAQRLAAPAEKPAADSGALQRARARAARQSHV